MGLRLSTRVLSRSLLSIGLAVGAVFALAPPAQANVVTGPFRRYCTVHARQVSFDFWIEYQSDNSFSVYRFAWDTHSFTPSRMVVSLRQSDGRTPLVRAWGGSASTLHDVSATGDTGPNWGTTGYWTVAYPGVFARVYLNADEYCTTSLVET